jgi:Glutaredoxin-like domain (DUF836)
MQTLILYSKSGCHLCEGLQEKLEQIQSAPESGLAFQLEIRDIAQQEQWLQAYQYEVPVLHRLANKTESGEMPIPRPSPRLSVGQLTQFLQPYLQSHF